MQLPEDLRHTIDDLLHGYSTASLSLDYQRISERYRRQTAADSLQITSLNEALAYAAVRLPATYGAVANVLSQLKRVMPDFKPDTAIDLGAGPGTATLAALEMWPDSLKKAELIEPNPHLRAVSEKLLSIKEVDVLYQPKPLSSCELKPADLLIASYVLNEIPSLDLEKEISRLWDKTEGTLVLIEPGTPLGYDIILQARDVLINQNATIAAPCPHTTDCPLRNTGRWCHFSTRIERTSMHRKIKDNATLGYEDEKFSYLVASRQPKPVPVKARLLGHPHGQKLIDLELCKDDGTVTLERVSKRDQIYKTAKKLKWGDSL